MASTSEKIQIICNWLNEKKQETNLKCFVVGVSGGVDSALTSTLCAKSGVNTIVVSMPIHQKQEQLEYARAHIDWLQKTYDNVSYVEKDLTGVFEVFKETLSDIKSDLSLANTRSRIRMTALYQIAQVNQGLVVGTGNKVEDFGVGFFTKYGDGGVDISPIADLMKSEVTAMARALHVSEEICLAPPTDGLWDCDRTDEEQLGATYSELEWAMNYDRKSDKTQINAKQTRILELYYDWHNKNKHKMVPIPICKFDGE